jgi:hypothetical protein
MMSESKQFTFFFQKDVCPARKCNRFKYYVINLEFISKNTKINKVYGIVFVINVIPMWLLIGDNKYIEEINPLYIT